MKNIFAHYVYRVLSLLTLASILATTYSSKAFMEEPNVRNYPHNLQTLCNELGTISYTTINKFEALKQIVNELKKSIPTKLYPKVFKEHGIDFTTIGENNSNVPIDVKKHLYNVAAALEEFREKKLIELKKQIITLQNNYKVDKGKLQAIENTIKHVASHGTTEHMLNTFHEQEYKLMLLEKPELAQVEITYVEQVVPVSEVIKPSQKPFEEHGEKRESVAEEHPEEEEKEDENERQQDDHMGLNDNDLDEVYRKLTIHIKRSKRAP